MDFDPDGILDMLSSNEGPARTAPTKKARLKNDVMRLRQELFQARAEHDAFVTGVDAALMKTAEGGTYTDLVENIANLVSVELRKRTVIAPDRIEKMLAEIREIKARLDGIAPVCDLHRAVQHRDGQVPWCNRCGWTNSFPSVPARKIQDVKPRSLADQVGDEIARRARSI